jgi:NADH-quinone oxidoreductase subunit E
VGQRGAAVSILQELQEEYHYLPRPALELVEAELGIPLSHLYRVATFYKAFSLEPRGKYYSKMNPLKIEAVIRRYASGRLG